MSILPDFYADLESCLANLPIKPPADRPMTQDEFFDFCQQNRKLRFERTAEGELILNPPTGAEAGMQIVALGAQLFQWAKQTGRGVAFGSSVGYVLPNGANRSPSASWISQEQLETISREQWTRFLPGCPFFLIELKTFHDSFRKLQDKMDEYMANGSRLGWLIDPDKKQVHVYRPGHPVEVLDNPATVSADPELPGFVLDLEPVWRP